ncbi:MAG: hypothetical protein PF487_06500 [Bacteroidales bacterium]|jgi:hypothetical protein|nr:hypothetical protein [Bacteroidales bacterium]
MQQLSIILLLIIININCFADGRSSTSAIDNKSETKTHKKQLANYQQFKSDFANIDFAKSSDFSNIGRGRGNDNLMLYVAGGIALGTTTLVLINNPDNAVMPNAKQANTGVIVGGIIATGMIVTKYFIDKNSRR